MSEMGTGGESGTSKKENVMCNNVHEEDDFLARPARVKPVYPSPVRESLDLDGEWEFILDPKNKGIAEKWYLGEESFPNKILVPGNWNAQGFGGYGYSQVKDSFSDAAGQGPPVRGCYYGSAWYCRKFTVPDSWRGKIAWLKFGGAMSSIKIWINGEFVGARYTSHGTSFKYEVTEFLAPGKENYFVARLDNRVEKTASFSHLERYAMWGGLYDSVELEAAEKAFIDDVFILPEIDMGATRLKVNFRNDSTSKATYQLEAQIREIEGKGSSRGEMSVTLDARSGKEVELLVRMEKVKLWSPEEPNLYLAEVNLSSQGKIIDSFRDRFGMRKIEAREGRIYFNNEPIILRGQHFNWFCAKTLSPPLEKDFYRQFFQKLKDYGFNYLRTPWILPQVSFDSADEVGIMIQVERDFVHGNIEKEEKLITRQVKEFILEYRNHPSLVTYSMSNEHWKGTPFTVSLYRLAKRMDPTRLAMDSDGATPPVRETCDLWLEDTNFAASDWHRYMEKVARMTESYKKPFLDHEYLNLPTLPDVGIIKKYDQAMYAPLFLVNFKRWLEKEGLLQDYPRYLRSSYELQALHVKEGIEVARKHPEKDGFSMCAWNDMPDTCIWWGLLNLFLEDKALSSEKMQQFNSESVLLVKLPARQEDSPFPVVPPYTHFYGYPLRVEFLISHYGKRPIEAGVLEWSLVSDGNEIQRGSLKDVNALSYQVSSLAKIKIPPFHLSQPRKVTLKVVLNDKEIYLENNWDLWFFPKARETLPLGKKIAVIERLIPHLTGKYISISPWNGNERPDLLITDNLYTLDPARKEVIDYLLQGGRVLLLCSEDSANLMTGFWPGWFLSGNRHLGTVIENHPALGDFPHEGFASWQFKSLIFSGMVFSDRPVKLEPIMSGIVNPVSGLPEYLNPALPKAIVHLFQCGAEKGKLLVCSLKLIQDIPEATYLFDQLLRYALSEKFAPQVSLNAKELENLGRELSLF